MPTILLFLLFCGYYIFQNKENIWLVNIMLHDDEKLIEHFLPTDISLIHETCLFEITTFKT